MTELRSEDEQSLRATSHWKLLLGIAVFVAIFLLMKDAEHQQRVVAAVFGAAVAFWITEALPVAITAFVSTVALVALGGLPHDKAFGSRFSSRLRCGCSPESLNTPWAIHRKLRNNGRTEFRKPSLRSRVHRFFSFFLVEALRLDER